jgi:hypothetical protein
MSQFCLIVIFVLRFSTLSAFGFDDAWIDGAATASPPLCDYSLELTRRPYIASRRPAMA